MIGLVRNPKLLSMITKLTIIFIGGIICLGCYPEIRSGILFTPTPVLPDPTKQMVSSNFPIIERWRWAGLTFNSIIITSENQIILASDYWGGENIIVFDAHTGSIIWESENTSSIDSFDADDKRVYIGSVLHVQAYDLETGQVLWEGAKQPRYKRGGFNVYLKNDQLEVYDSYNSRFYLLDSKTGQTIEEVPLLLPFFKRENIYYSGTCGTPKMNCLQATDVLNGESLWFYKFEGGIYSWPVFVDNTMFVNGGGTTICYRYKNRWPCVAI